MVHGTESTHQTLRSALPGGPGRIAPSGHGPSEAVLLTVRQVAERLHLSTGWVYRRIESGELGHVRVGDNAIRVSAADLDRYLRRFPGIEAPKAPEAQRQAPALPRKRGAQ